MIKEKLNDTNLNDINGGIELKEAGAGNSYSIDDNRLLQKIQNDSDLKGTINDLLNLSRVQKATLTKGLSLYFSDTSDPNNKQELIMVQDKLFNFAKNNATLAYELAKHYGIA